MTGPLPADCDDRSDRCVLEGPAPELVVAQDTADGWEGRADASSVAPGLVTPTQHGPHLLAPTHEPGVTGPGAVENARSPFEPPNLHSQPCLAGARLAPPKPVEDAGPAPIAESVAAAGGERAATQMSLVACRVGGIVVSVRRILGIGRNQAHALAEAVRQAGRR